MNDNKYILSAYVFDGKGGASALEHNDVFEELKGEHLTWVHLDADSDETATWLATNVSYLDSLAIEALLADETRPRIEEFDAGALIILRGVNLQAGAEPEDMISIRLWVDKTRIISLRKRQLRAVDEMETRINSGRAPKTSGEFVTTLSSLIFANMEPVIQWLNENTDELEAKQLLDTPDVKLRHDIITTRIRAITLKRYITPQRDVIIHLRMSEQKWVGDKERRYFLEIHDRVVRYIEDLDMVRERAQVIQDEITNTIAESLGRNMYVLSIISAIFLPLGFVTGLFGTNLRGIPWANNADGFMILSAVLVLLVTMQMLIFKKMRWF